MSESLEATQCCAGTTATTAIPRSRARCNRNPARLLTRGDIARLVVDEANLSEAFRAAEREIAILSSYLPMQMTRDEIEAEIRHMLTARRDLQSVQTARKNGISSYIVKPFDADDLKAKIISATRKTMIVGELPRHY